MQLSDGGINFNEIEKKILRKTFEWPKIVENSSNKLEPHRITFYLYELYQLYLIFFLSKGNEEEKYRIIINGKLNRSASLLILQLLSSVIRNGMQILGVSLPEKM